MKLPPMNALRAFEAVSRQGSVSKAAEELCVSQGAVSQQLRNLEDYFGRELFLRSANKVELSEDGEAFATVVQKTLADIADAANGIIAKPQQNRLTISTWRGFAVKWLMPNLGAFYEHHPDVTVVLDESNHVVTFRNDGIDGAIRYGDGEFGDVESLLLFQPRIRAVASPGYLCEHGPLKSLAEPGEHHLIDNWNPLKDIRAQHRHWEDFVEGNQIGPDTQYTALPDEHQAFNAALQGRGIALSTSYMIEDELQAGKIDFACEGSIPTLGKIYFVWPPDARPNPALDAFRDWLVDALGKYREDRSEKSA